MVSKGKSSSHGSCGGSRLSCRCWEDLVGVVVVVVVADVVTSSTFIVVVVADLGDL